MYRHQVSFPQDKVQVTQKLKVMLGDMLLENQKAYSR
jgi:hypothetical protein